MRFDWKEYTLDDVCERIFSGGTPSTMHSEYWNGTLKWLSSGETSQRFIYDTERKITELGVKNSSTKLATRGCTVIATAGQGFTRGQASFLMTDTFLNQSVIACKPNEKYVLPMFLYYNLDNRYEEFRLLSDGTSTRGGLSGWILKRMTIMLPPLPEQKKIAAILSALDEKIAINRAINDNLQQQVMALYRQMFIENTNAARRECRADEYFDISIGKTPPRKEPQWFSENPADFVWASISDMGSCGLFIANSSEYLTYEAVEKFNFKVVPDNTVLLSFKLTVGRIAITDGAMTTNEAIAHFKTNKPEINEYLYCYLKNFNYQTMGSTSSIATAVNSKIIKGMPFVVPTEGELAVFHGFAGAIFAMIKNNQRENNRLATLRDTLLPKLMSGEIDVSGI